MRKYLLSMYTMMMVAMLSFNLSSCSKDDDGDGESSGLVGAWKRIEKIDTKYEKVNGNWEQLGDPRVSNYSDRKSVSGYLFNEDHTAAIIDINQDGSYEIEEKFQYKTEGNKLFMLEQDQADTDDWEEVGSFNFDNGILVITEIDEEENRKEVEVIRYSKVVLK